jgi:N-acetylglucosamine kinase-like BadF-type ATPase
LAVAAFGVIGFLLLFAIGTASLGRDGSSQATLGPWSFAVGDSVLCAVLAAYNFALIL